MSVGYALENDKLHWRDPAYYVAPPQACMYTVSQLKLLQTLDAFLT